jgi:ABC-type dipeptide/oligopeptide/nickel transport system permease component
MIVSKSEHRGISKMREIIKKSVLIINVLSLTFVFIFFIFGLIENIFGAPGLDNLLKRLNIPMNSDSVLLFSIISIAIMIVSYILLKKVWDN